MPMPSSARPTDTQFLRFAEHCHHDTSACSIEPVFDSGLTSYANLAKLDELNIAFLTLRSQLHQMMTELRNRPPTDWQRIQLNDIGDERIRLRDYSDDNSVTQRRDPATTLRPSTALQLFPDAWIQLNPK